MHIKNEYEINKFIIDNGRYIQILDRDKKPIFDAYLDLPLETASTLSLEFKLKEKK